MLKKRKAQGMSIKIIIVAIIGLIILAVVVMMLTGKLGDFRSGTKNLGDVAKTCAGQDGDLIDKSKECPKTKPASIASSDSLAQGKKCCASGIPSEPSGTASGGNVDGLRINEPTWVDIGGG